MIYNLYSPGRQQAICHFFHGFRPDNNVIICRDFNSHHKIWYSHQVTQHQSHLRRDAKLADVLVEKLVSLSLVLQNEPGVYTHFPRNGTSPSIVDLTFTRGHAKEGLLNWTLGEDFGSDHLSTHLHLSSTAGPGIAMTTTS